MDARAGAEAEGPILDAGAVQTIEVADAGEDVRDRRVEPEIAAAGDDMLSGVKRFGARFGGLRAEITREIAGAERNAANARGRGGERIHAVEAGDGFDKRLDGRVTVSRGKGAIDVREECRVVRLGYQHAGHAGEAKAGQILQPGAAAI